MADVPRKKLNILLLSVHGLIRGVEPELGRDADTGGQVLYVLDLARHLARSDEVESVEVITRRIQDVKVDPIYSRHEEILEAGAKIVRIDAGPRRYLRKENLWPYIDELADGIVRHISASRKIPDVIHGHYADAGYIGAQLSRLLGVPFVFTGHSLGRVKQLRLRARGLSDEAIESRYNIRRRIDAEEVALETASFVVTSTEQEVGEQYALYGQYDPVQKRVIPPGIDLSRYRPPERRQEHTEIRKELHRFLRVPNKPIVLAISRADERKNISTLVEAFANTPELRKRANLVILAGNRNTIGELDPGARKVLRQLLIDIDRYDLYGSVAYPKQHLQEDIPALYRLAAQTRGVFVNPALTEPFGLTLIEAAASGLPVIATNDGGPQDILRNCDNGELVDPLDAVRMGNTILDSLTNRHRWKRWSRNGLKNVQRHYSWNGHVRKYLNEVRKVSRRHRSFSGNAGIRNPLPIVDRLLICDIDNTLVGDGEALQELMRRIDNESGRVGFGIATGRHVNSALKVLKVWGVRKPDLLITDVGTQIYYGDPVAPDKGWRSHIDYRWEPERIREVMSSLKGLHLQPEENQQPFKISYDLEGAKPIGKRMVIRHLRQQGIRVNVIHSHNAYLDILPMRASKGLATRYLSLKWGLSMERILVAGDSGNDADMLGGNVLGVVVGNYSPELKILKGKPHVFFARGEYARGVIEGIEHYDFFGSIVIPGEEQERGNEDN
ncbi:MAG: HAD-IIB family hydrolase [bacterium]